VTTLECVEKVSFSGTEYAVLRVEGKRLGPAQVQTLVGLAVLFLQARSKWTDDSVAAALKGDKRVNAPTAPPHALLLDRVLYLPQDGSPPPPVLPNRDGFSDGQSALAADTFKRSVLYPHVSAQHHTELVARWLIEDIPR